MADREPDHSREDKRRSSNRTGVPGDPPATRDPQAARAHSAAGTIGFVGLGSMGEPMARNLLGSGFRLRVYNRTREKTEPLVRLGATSAAVPREVGEPGGIAISMVADDAALSDVTLGEDGLLEGLGVGGLHISMSTVSPELALRLTAAHRERASAYVAAPVFGRPDAAAARKLWICAAGEPAGVQRARPILEALGQGIFEFGPNPPSANVIKLCGNFLILGAIEALAETCVLAEKNGVERRTFVDFIAQTLFACPAYQNYGRIVAADRYEPAGIKLSLGFKDASLIVGAANSSLVPMPLARLVHQRFVSAMSQGREGLDWAAIALSVAEEAGLKRHGVH
jgi:3-hydroxyisobutyrate dehydrogenase-like beta-hydroxyacid dehydrogenase